MRNSLLFSFLVCAFFAHAAFSAELGENDYLNNYEVPVLIKVPYYEKGASKPRPYDLMLQPGDLYKSRPGKNGLVYEKYGLIEKTFAEFNKKQWPTPVVNCLDIREKINKRYEKYLEGLKSEKMPKDWVKEHRFWFSNEVKNIEYKIKDQIEWNKNGDNDVERLKRLERAKAFFESIRSRIDDLEDPSSDPDKDGLDNRTEFARGTNPYLKDYVSAYPMYYEVVYDYSPVVTGTFYLVNSFKKPVNVNWNNSLNHSSDFYKLNINYNGQPIPQKSITLPPASTNRLDCFFNAEAFPRFFDEAYRINFDDVTNEYGNAYLTVQFHTYEDNSQPLTSPDVEKPDKGSLFSCRDNLTFSWREPEGKAMKSDRAERIHYKLQFIDPFGRNGERDVSKGGNSIVKKHQNFKPNDLNPGTYFWRVNKQDRFHAPVSSFWSWFAVGREIDVPPKLDEDYYRYRDRTDGYYCNDATIVYAVTGKEYKMTIGYSATKDSRFLLPLMENNQEVYCEENSRTSDFTWYVKGKFDSPGLYTNIWLNIRSSGLTNVCPTYFIVRNPASQKDPRTYYDAEGKYVVHELFKNVTFSFKEKEYFNSLTRKEGFEWGDISNKEFDPPLPEGLKAEDTKDGDWEIKGFPTVSGVFTNAFIFSSGENTASETHIFRIKDIGEPIPEVEKTLKTRFDEPRRKKRQ